ncbi:tyrosine-type recombinase/integrase [Rhodococcus wratislaviensis]|uniref:tyrosine-type recombinase/integrase n=1 Tax=Rhodococcus wratislaviensis TaxID=44752 RepID=UPI000F572E9C
MLTQNRAVMSVTNTQVLSLHTRPPASRTPRRESSTSNATPTRPHTATADTSHTFATRLLRGIDCDPVPIDVVQSLLGHASINSTRIYTHDTEAAMRTTTSALAPRSTPPMTAH